MGYLEGCFLGALELDVPFVHVGFVGEGYGYAGWWVFLELAILLSYVS